MRESDLDGSATAADEMRLSLGSKRALVAVREGSFQNPEQVELEDIELWLSMSTGGLALGGCPQGRCR
jgi:hypothetical protein